MNRILTGACVLAALLGAAPAHAVIFNQTVNFSSAIPGSNTQNLQQFNTPGFTLQAVTLTFTSNLNGVVTVVSRSGNNRTASSTFRVDSVLSSSAFTSFNSTVAAAPVNFALPGRATVTANLGGSSTATQNPTNLAAFVGTDTIPILLTIQNLVSSTTIINGGAGNFTATPGGNVSGVLSVDYDASAIPPFPEPATWVSMILGLGFIGAAQRRRRTAVAA